MSLSVVSAINDELLAEEQHHRPSSKSYAHEGQHKHSGEKENSWGSKKHGNHNHHSDHGSKKWMDKHNSDHGGSHEKDEKTSKGNYWDKYGEKEKVIKDKGSGFIKAFTWDREEINKDKWGDKGGKYRDSKKSSKGKKWGKKSSASGGKSAWGHEGDQALWGGQDYANSLNGYSDLASAIDWTSLAGLYKK